MAATFELSIITPENEFFSGQADMLVLPCEDGEVGIMANHAPMIASIPPGALRLCVDGQWRLVSVSDGFATVTPERVLVLVQTAERPEDIDINRAERDRLRALEVLRDFRRGPLFCLFHPQRLGHRLPGCCRARQAWPCVHPVALPPGNDMNMQVGNRLPGAGSAGMEQVDALIAAVRHAMACHTPYALHQVRQRFLIHIQQAFTVLLGDGQHVAVYIPGYVEYHYRFSVLRNLQAGRRPRNDLAEHTIFHWISLTSFRNEPQMQDSCEAGCHSLRLFLLILQEIPYSFYFTGKPNLL